jgi:hypothetical protein
MSNSKFGPAYFLNAESQSPSRLNASIAARTISTFSYDIAYSRSPAALSASSRVKYSRPVAILPSRVVKTIA